MWPAMPASKPCMAKIRKAVARRTLPCSRSASLLAKRGGSGQRRPSLSKVSSTCGGCGLDTAFLWGLLRWFRNCRRGGATPGYDCAMDLEQRFLSVHDCEAAARARLPRGLHGFVAGGSADGWSAANNRAAFDRWALVPRTLAAGPNRRQDLTLFGQEFSSPCG